jgi:hypothetical protein
MRQVEFPVTLTAKVDTKTRQAVVDIASRSGLSLGQVVRDLLAEGMKARGLMA